MSLLCPLLRPLLRPLLSRILSIAVVLAVTMGSASNATAQSQATGAYFNVLYNLVDLNPADGIDPGITFSGASSNAQARLYDLPDFAGPTRETVQLSGAEGPIRFATDSSGFHVYNNVTSTTGSGVNFIERGSSLLTFQSSRHFSLAPYTGITFTADASVGEQTGPGGDASAIVSMVGVVPDGTGGNAEYRTGLSSDAGQSSGNLALTMASGADELEGSINLSARLSANVLAVPEPASMALLMAGLGLIGARRRRCSHYG